MKFINQHISKRNYATMLIITLLTQVTAVVPAFAGDNKVYPGSGCLPVSAESGSRLIRSGGKITNADSQNNLILVCPIIRDVTTGGVPNSFIDITGGVRLDSCTLNTYNVDGTLVARNQDSDGRFTSLSGGGFRLDIQNASQASQGAYEIACILPPGASLVRYSLSE